MGMQAIADPITRMIKKKIRIIRNMVFKKFLSLVVAVRRLLTFVAPRELAKGSITSYSPALSSSLFVHRRADII